MGIWKRLIRSLGIKKFDTEDVCVKWGETYADAYARFLINCKCKDNDEITSKVNLPQFVDLDSIKAEYKLLTQLERNIQEQTYIKNIYSKFQLLIYIEEIRKIIEDSKSYFEFYDEQRLSALGKRIEQMSWWDDVYVNENTNTVYRSIDLFRNDDEIESDPQWRIYHHLLHNMLFPNVPYHFLGIGVRKGVPTLVYSHPFIRDMKPASDKEVEKYMKLQELKKLEHWNRYGNEYLIIGRTYHDNVLSDKNGTLYFIEHDIYPIKHPKKIIDFYISRQSK